MWRQPRAGHGRLPLSAREGPVSATTFVAHSSDPRVVGTLVGVEATPLQNPDSPRREFSAHILPMPGSPRAGFGGVPGVRVPAKHHYHSPAGAQMDPLWSPPKGGKGVNAPFSKGACTLCSPPPRPAVGSLCSPGSSAGCPGAGWNLQPTDAKHFTKHFQESLAQRVDEHDVQGASQETGKHARRRYHFVRGTRFFDPRTDQGCAIDSTKTGLHGRTFGPKEQVYAAVFFAAPPARRAAEPFRCL